MFHKRKERKDCRGSFWRRSLSFLLVLLLMAGCVQVVGNQAEAASEPLSEFQPETQAGMEGTGTAVITVKTGKLVKRCRVTVKYK